MDGKLVSLIITAYNADKYLQRCLDSVLNQTYTNLEIILVDDGSTDSSGRILDTYAAKDKRMYVIHQKNAGLSIARNNALAVATGEYLGFTDADDKLEADYVETLVKHIHGYDMVVCGFHFITGDGKVLERCLPKNCVMTGLEFLKRYLDDEIITNHGLEICPIIGGYVWNKLYRRQIWGNIRFLPHRNMEDSPAITSYISRSKHINCITDCKYFYYKTLGSITNHKGINSHSRDIIVTRKAQRNLVRIFLREQQLCNQILLNQADLLVILAYFNLIRAYLRTRKIGSFYYQQCVQDFRKELCMHVTCLRMCKNLSTIGKLLLCAFMPEVYFRVLQFKKMFLVEPKNL